MEGNYRDRIKDNSQEMDRIEGDENLYIGGIWGLRLPSRLVDNKITHILSVIKYSLSSIDGGMTAGKVDWDGFVHMDIDVDDVADEDMLVHIPGMVRFIDRGLHGGTDGGGVFVHCAMGRSRSATAVMAYLLWKHPARFGRGQAGTTSAQAVDAALGWVRRTRSAAGPNEGFMDQLRLWCDMGCPAAEGKLEKHPVYRRWAYAREVDEAARCGRPPDTLRFADEERDMEKEDGDEDEAGLEVRCKKCRRVLATKPFVVRHNGESAQERLCPHIFVEALSWMRPVLEAGALDGRLVCPGVRCGASVGRYAWQGFKCSCGEWLCPAFSLQRAKVDEVAVLGDDMAVRMKALGIRMPPGAVPAARVGLKENL